MAATPAVIRILILEDNPADVKLALRCLSKAALHFEADITRSGAEFVERLHSSSYDVILGDYHLPDWTALDALHWLRNAGSRLPFILLTGTLGDELAVECIKEGATDYVLKDKLDHLPLAVERSLREARLRADRDRVQEQLQASEREYRSTIEHAPYGMYRVNSSGEILKANPALVAMLGYESEEQVLRLNTSTDIYCDRADRLRELSHWQSKGVITGYEVPWRHRSGKTIIVRLGGRTLTHRNGAPEVYEVFVEDITEQRSMEMQFQQAQKMEAVGRLAGGIAHDFNNLLMVIGSSAQLLDESAENPGRVARYADQIRSATDKAASLTRQLLAFSRQQVLHPEILDLNAAIVDLWKMLPRLLGEDIETVMALAPSLGRINVDRGQLEQIIMNLSINARDAMPEGGTLTIKTGDVDLSGGAVSVRGVKTRPGPYVMMSIRDSGTGMDAEVQARIFEPFFTTKDTGKGTGLGLATVYGIVEQSGGMISVDSQVAKGTTFSIYFPRTITPAEVTPAQASSVSVLSGAETILLAEDEIALREIASEYLQSKGYTVLLAKDGAEALELCTNQSRRIDVLITDVVMPGMSGVKLATAALHARPYLCVIYMSGYTDRAMQDEGLDPRTIFLQKPFSLDALARKLRHLLDSR